MKNIFQILIWDGERYSQFVFFKMQVKQYIWNEKDIHTYIHTYKHTAKHTVMEIPNEIFCFAMTDYLRYIIKQRILFLFNLYFRYL